MKKSSAGICLVSILALHVLLLGWGACAHCPTVDEIAYLPAGLSHWQLGNFELAKVSPPLIRTIAAVPLLVVGTETHWSKFAPGPGLRAWHEVGLDFVKANGPRSLWLFTLGRWMLIPLSVLGGGCCYVWGRTLAGPRAGLLSSCLWCFCPNIIAHAQLVTADAGATSLGIVAGYTFWRWLKRPSWGSASLAGIALGCAESAKTTLLPFVILWPLLWLAWKWPLRRSESQTTWAKEGAHIVLIMFLAWYVLNVVYGFDGSFKRLDRFVFVSRTFAGNVSEPETTGNRFVNTWLGAIPVPFPEEYVLGIDLQKDELDNDDGSYRSYLHGHWSTHGWWYYYLYCLAIKIPLGTWFLFAIAIYRRARAGVAESVLWRNDLLLLVPFCTIVVFVSSQTGFSMHFRYVLPALPFAFVWIAQSIFDGPPRSRMQALAVAAGLSCSIVSSLWAAPHHLSYFNELVGGPLGGRLHLADSNLDWGQDLIYLRKWIDAHPDALPMSVTYLGLFPRELIGIDFPGLQSAPAADSRADAAVKLRPGWYAISVGCLQDYPNRGNLQQFRSLAPTAFAGYSIYLYHVHDDRRTDAAPGVEQFR